MHDTKSAGGLSAVCRGAEAAAPGTFCQVYAVEPRAIEIEGRAAPSLPAQMRDALQRLPIGDKAGACAAAAYFRRPVGSDIATDPLWDGCRDIALRYGLHSCHALPLLDPNGELLGVMAAYLTSLRALEPGECAVLELAAGRAALLLERERLAETLGDLEERLACLFSLSSDWYWEQDAQLRYTRVSGGVVAMLGLARTDYAGKARWEIPGLEPVDADWDSHRAALQARQPFRDFVLRAMGADGKSLYMSSSGQPHYDARGCFKGYRGIGKDVTERYRAAERIHQLAFSDTLTGLPNRALFQERLASALARARRNQQQVVALFLDLDRFKNVNDTLGHDSGDRLLQAVAQRLRAGMRETDTIARLGGDEFVVLIENPAGHAEIGIVARKIIQAVAGTYPIGDRQCRVSASVGISVFPLDATDGQQLLRLADIAMYKAKEKGGEGYCFYAEAMDSYSVERLALEPELSRGLKRGELVMHYQPKLDMAGDRITGVEALVRWRHPRLGLLQPQHFIALAEETGLIIEVGQWVLNAACLQAAEWRCAGLDAGRMAVNLSARHFECERIVEQVRDALAASGLPADALELEITESMVIRSPERAEKALRDLRGLGVHLAVDDFGAGHASIAYLRQFPIGTIKLDRSVVQDLAPGSHDAAIARHLIAMAHSLGMTVVAEGVESERQREILGASDCDECQGFLFSRPLDAAAMRALLAQPGLLRRDKRGSAQESGRARGFPPASLGFALATQASQAVTRLCESMD